ncbi:ParB N-terminal domain-containing protein [Sphingomonas nostoxanthinifaciens]|uniref:hypothetical protein n=1 Tax=Sphingomonas nostoxanthinifaciens TaxID=2872652 RepID=UPI001CC2115F|nr:hypothetical protein [Sphingomonas nostoxanthinifaciens]UAK24380.1 hypothetical protein K8P63_19045 [Sphingomonas nostoxanthinifaciens]
MTAPNSTINPSPTPAPERVSSMITLTGLDLDPSNPRFGGRSGSDATQRDILNRIVQIFGVGDVLSSLAVNGFFQAEPLVGRRQASGRITIMEGNRRLAACLVLAGDARAVDQSLLGEQARGTWLAHGKKPIDPIPVIVFEEHEQTRELLSYLGVRHISASSPWDSYAKAAWVAEVVRTASLSVSEVSQMVGDRNQTVSRLLEGYYFINQVERAGKFSPKNSVRSGRGSVTAYPFSWVYTILGYLTTRVFLSLPEGAPVPDPVPAERLDNAGLLCRAMFGDNSRGQNSAVSDSRQLGDLAAVLASPDKVALLEQGMSVEAITRVSRPIDERLRQGFAEIRRIQGEILSGLSEQPVAEDVAISHTPAAVAARRTAQAIENQLRTIVNPADD